MTIPIDAEGLVTTALPEAAAAARLVYVTPSHQFPTGAIMSLVRRLALLQWAETAEAYVLEDDYDSEFRYAGRPVEAVQGLDRSGRVIYVGTFSKVLFPALRLGYLVLPPPLVPLFTAAKWLADRHTSTLEQAVLTDFIHEGHFEHHLRRHAPGMPLVGPRSWRHWTRIWAGVLRCLGPTLACTCWSGSRMWRPSNSAPSSIVARAG